MPWWHSSARSDRTRASRHPLRRAVIAALFCAAPGGAQVLAAEPIDIAEGRRTFMVHCSHCHGVQGNGAYAPNLTDGETLHGSSFEAILNVVTNGVNGTPMRAWSKTFDTARREKVAAYVHSLFDGGAAD